MSRPAFSETPCAGPTCVGEIASIIQWSLGTNISGATAALTAVIVCFRIDLMKPPSLSWLGRRTGRTDKQNAHNITHLGWEKKPGSFSFKQQTTTRHLPSVWQLFEFGRNQTKSLLGIYLQRATGNFPHMSPKWLPLTKMPDLEGPLI